MRPLRVLVFLLGLAVPSLAGDFDEVIKTARQVWPERRTVVVVCNKDASAMALMDLGSATEKVINLMVVDLNSAKNIEKALGNVIRKPWGEIFVLLIPDDPLTGEGTEASRILVSRMTSRGIPVVGTTVGSLKTGAVFALGPGTENKLLTNPDMAKKLGVTLPEIVAPVK